MEKAITPAALPAKAEISLGRRFWKLFMPILVVYLVLLFGQQAGLEPGRIIREMIDNPTIIVQQLIVGVANAAIITIIAMGYTMVYGIVENINFAHSSVFMLSTFAALLFMSWLMGGESKIPLWGALLAFIPAMVFGGALNGAIERIAYRSLRKNARIVGMIAGMGVDFILVNLGLVVVGSMGKLPNAFPKLDAIKFLKVLGLQNASPKSFPAVNEFFSAPGVPLNLLESIDPNAAMRVTPADVIVIVSAVILTLGLNWFVTNTRQGKGMRAVAQNQGAAAMMGIDVDRTINLTYVIGGALAGAAAVMWGLYNGSTSSTVGATSGLNAFTAAVLGGVGNLKGAALGALFIGLLSALSDQFISSRWTNAWVFLTLVLVMLIKPTGILGSEGGEKA
jgi:branched-chain amino acid transport system permease protein